MTPAETARLLAGCAAYDQRTVGKADVTAWHLVLADLTYADAERVVIDWYRENRERVMPADVVAGVRRIRLARLDKAPTMTELMDDVDPQDPNWQPIYAARRKAIADGRPPLKAVEA